MAERDRFTEQEWKALVMGPSGAVGAVVAADEPGLMNLMRESLAVGKALRRARKEDDWPPVVAELIADQEHHKPERSAPSENPSMEQALSDSLHVLDEAAVVAKKLTPAELDAYVEWVLGLSLATAEAVTEKGSDRPISDAEQKVLDEIESRLRGTASEATG